MTEEPEAFRDSRFTAEISTRMQVPDRIMVVGENQTRSPTFVGVNGPSGPSFGRDMGDKFEMMVPDRILVAGRDQHIAGKSTPFEMQVEQAVMPAPPSRNEIRVNTPPRAIRLDEHTFSNDHTEDDEESLADEDDPIMAKNAQEQASPLGLHKRILGGKFATPRSTSAESESFQHGRNASDPSMSMMETIHGGSGHSMNPWEEIQIVRRQIAKLNHRLMAVELENQQQQQREMILTVLVSAYFVGKIFMWLNRSM